MILKTTAMKNGTTREVCLTAWKKDTVDPRDFRLKSLKSAIPNAPIPVSVDNTSWCSPVANQGDIGSCTAHSVTGALEYNDKRFNVKPTKLRISRLFTYYATRLIEGTVGEDSGASMRNAIKSTVTYGCIRESRWWYNVAKLTVNPSKKLWDAAETDKVASYYKIDDGDLDTIKRTIASGHVVCFGMAVFNEMLTAHVAETGIVPSPSTDAEPVGGHAVLIVGYDDAKKAFKVRNSWGKNWGQKGYFWIGYDYVGNVDLCNDFWVIVSAVDVA